MKKLPVTIACAASLIFLVAGCGSSNGEEAKPKGTAPESIDLTKQQDLTPQQQQMMKARGSSGEGGDAGTTEGR